MDTKNDLSIFSQSMFVRFLDHGLLKSTVYSFLWAILFCPNQAQAEQNQAPKLK